MAQGIKSRFGELADVLLVGPVGPNLQGLLGKDIRVPSSCLLERDEVHLIMEYQANETLGRFTAPTSNRFIVSHDIHNARMEFLQSFFELTRSFEPDIIILSGLHLLESQSESFR